MLSSNLPQHPMKRRPALRVPHPAGDLSSTALHGQIRTALFPIDSSHDNCRRNSTTFHSLQRKANTVSRRSVDVSYSDTLTSLPSSRFKFWKTFSTVVKKLPELNQPIATVCQSQNAGVSTRPTDPTQRVPDHVLGLIFRHACPLPPHDIQIHSKSRDSKRHHHVAMTLGSVSSRWRTLSRSTPVIWAAVSVGVTTTNVPQKTRLLRLYIKNSRELPIHLEISWNYRDTRSTADWNILWDPIASAMFQNESVDKMFSLRLENPPSTWLVQKLSSQNITLFPALKNLTIISNTEQPRFLVNPDCYSPSLEQLILEKAVPPLNFSWYTITIVKLRRLHPNECVKLLLRCKNLVEFDCSEPDLQSKVSNPLKINEIIILSYLRSSRWAYSMHPSEAFLAFLRFPELRRLRWEQVSIGVDPDVAGLFMAKLPLNMIESFELIGAEICDHRLLGTILLGRHGLKEITLRGCDDLTIERVLTVFMDPEAPVLQSISIIGCVSFKRGDTKAWIGQMLFDVLRRWSYYPHSRLKARLEDIDLEWTTEVKQSCSRIVQRGCQLDLTVDSWTPDWLYRR